MQNVASLGGMDCVGQSERAFILCSNGLETNISTHTYSFAVTYVVGVSVSVSISISSISSRLVATNLSVRSKPWTNYGNI